VSEQEHAHGPQVSGENGVNSLGEGDGAARVFRGYLQDARKQRAWRAENPGNVAMREEVRLRLLQLAGPWVFGEGGPPDADGVISHSDRLVLDAGCGSGWWLQALAQAGVAPKRLVGVDLLEERVHTAQERVLGARVLQGDVRDLPLPDGSCALVLLFTVLSAMGGRHEVRRALIEVRRVLAPGGAVVIWEPRVWSPNTHTRLIHLRELRDGLGGEVTARSVTLLPPLARRAGRWYAPLARVPLLRTHRLVLVCPDR
jgi:SAM-dependent methyltransferase